MKNLNIFHTVNSGLCFYNNKVTIMIDMFHTGKEVGFSDYPENLLKEIKLPQNKTHLLFTHLHPDHYNKKMIEDFLEKNSQALVYSAGVCKGFSFANKEYSCEEYSFKAFKTIHEGNEFASFQHESFLINISDNYFFICGDCIIDTNLAEEILKEINANTTNKPADVSIFLNPFQLVSKSGHEFLKTINPKEIYLYHLPFENEDKYNYYKIAKQAIRLSTANGVPCATTIEHMQNIKL